MAMPDPELSGEDPMEWLTSTQGRGIVPGLERMERLLAAMGNPQASLRCLHVAGTNGKGSVSAFAESILRTMGIRTGLYTSPHLVDLSERFRINGENASSDAIEGSIRRVRAATTGWGEGDQPTFFELVTAMAFDLFARARCEVVVLETGLGGRLDATNTAPKLACAITPIGLDHTEWLGSTLAEIAREKAGIFRSGIPAVIAPQEPEAAGSLAEAARKVGTPCEWIASPIEGVRLGLAGSHQRWNAATAVALVRAAGFEPAPEVLEKGLGEVSWPGRFQRISVRGAELVLDGAHNLHAARQLVSTWREEYGESRCRLIFGALSDKNPGELLATLMPIASDITIVPVASSRSADPAALVASIGRIPVLEKPVVHIADSLQGALVDNLEASRRAPENSRAPVLLAGSLFLVGEALNLLSGGVSLPRIQ